MILISYPEIGKFILDILKDKKRRENLSDSLLEEIGLAAEDIMRPMKEMVKNDPANWQGPVIEMIMSKNSYLEFVGARFTSTGIVYEDIDTYRKLRDSFLTINDTNNSKPLYAAAIFFFREYSHDYEFHEKLKRYYERTIKDQLLICIQNFGGIDNAIKAQKASLSDSAKKEKHWVYQLFLDHLSNVSRNYEKLKFKSGQEVNLRQYPEIAKLLISYLERKKLPDLLLEEIGTAKASILWPLKETIKLKESSSQELIRKFIKSENEHYNLIGAKLAGSRLVKEDTELYEILKTKHESIDPENDTQFEKKIIYAFSLFFFDAYQNDKDTQITLKKYFINNLDQIVKIVVDYYGNIEITKTVLGNSLQDRAKETQRWISELILEKI